jgi:hypothetical protein
VPRLDSNRAPTGRRIGKSDVVENYISHVNACSQKKAARNMQEKSPTWPRILRKPYSEADFGSARLRVLIYWFQVGILN